MRRLSRRGQIWFAFVLLAAGFAIAAFMALRLVPGGARQGVLVEYVSGGGFAGVSERVVVYEGGRAVAVPEVGDRRSIMLTEAEFQQLREILAGGDWPLFSQTYGEPYPDAVRYQISYDRHTVVAYDPFVPDWMEPILRRLDLFLSDGPRQAGGGVETMDACRTRSFCPST
jgi:hypothetical protein